MSNVEKLSKVLKLAKQIVSAEEEPYKSAAFPIILETLLRNGPEPSVSGAELSSSSKHTITEHADAEETLTKLAQEVGVSPNELKNALEFDDGEFVFLRDIDGSAAERQVRASHCLLTAWMRGAGKEWISASMIRKSIDKLGVGSLGNLAHNLQAQGEIFRIKGEGKGTEYSLTTRGWREGLALLKTMALEAG